MRFVRILTSLCRPIFALMLAGCTSTEPSYTVRTFSVTPSALAFSAATSQTQNVTVSDSGYSGTFMVSGCTGIVTTSGPTNGTLSVSAGAAGDCTLTVADTIGHSASVAITVTTVSIPVQ